MEVERADAIDSFHPAVRAWFEERFADGPTGAQAQGWPQIASGADTLIAAPTGSGKTLAGFLVGIDAAYRSAEAGEEVQGAIRVVYVSPLRALAVDIAENLQRPLAEIAQVAARLGCAAPRLSVEVRNGDTTPAVRAAMLRHPPSFLVTTPESLYLMVTAERSRALLGTVRMVIVDEIHALCRDKRGSHLALTLERLEHCAAVRPQRVGLSATQRPIQTVARLLVGAGPGRSGPDGAPRCAVVDLGHAREADLAIELPSGELEAVASNELLGEVLDRIASLVSGHRTTLVFVNTRRMSERLAHLLAERMDTAGEGVPVAAHHGSLSKERRLSVERRLRAGELRCVVATASLELGIDIGPVELACQVGSPRAIATFLQRVGRSGHRRGGIPKGRLFPMTRDELVECTALLGGVRAGRLDALVPPVAPLDILAQQIVAECAAERWREDDLFALVRRAAPYEGLSRADFDEVVELVSEGIATGRGQRGAYVHRDGVNGELTGRRGARLAALTSGGAIPETGDYRVVAEPDDTFVGTVNEDWAIESMAGDVFLLGSTSWRIRRVEPGTVRVLDAAGAPPSVPFWLGEAPARTAELCEEVSSLRAGVAAALAGSEGVAVGAGPGDPGVQRASDWVAARCGVGPEVAAMVVRYLAAGRSALGCLPTLDQVVIERFFDESGGMQLVVHAPFGGRINRALGLALRKRFCVSFDFELQAAASDDAVLLSLGPQHSFALDSVPRFLSSASVEAVLRQATLPSPMFAARWRWNLNRSLVVLRYRGGRKNPPAIQRMEADDLMAAVFPALAACQENTTGPIQIPEHPLVRQTMHDCLHDAMDVNGLRGLVEGFESGRVRVACADTTEASPLAHEIVNGRPYTFLDDAPLEERRSRAVSLRRGLDLVPSSLSALDPDAIARVRAEAAPDPRDPDELHDLLCSVVVLKPSEEYAGWFDALRARSRAAVLVTGDGAALWYAVESGDQVEALFPGRAEPASAPGRAEPASAPGRAEPASAPGGIVGPEEAAALVLRGHLDIAGPAVPAWLVQASGLPASLVDVALARLEHEGFALRGNFDPGLGAGGEQWCSRRLLARIHRYTQRRLRAEISPVSTQDFMRFLLRWQHVAPDARREGAGGLAATIEQLQGFEIPAGTWEELVLPCRVAGYRREWLDAACASGEVAWGRLGVRNGATNGSGITSRATPITLFMRADLEWLAHAARGEARPLQPEAGAAREVLDVLAERGALFAADLASATRRLPCEISAALWDGVARGLVSADSFAAVRDLLARREPWSQARQARRTGLRRGLGGAVSSPGRWSLLTPRPPLAERDALAEAVAEQLLARWGVVVRDLMARENLAMPWREVIWALRRMEARGTVRGGRFVSGLGGEQYALAEAVEDLRAVRRGERTGETVTVSAADPLNLTGIVMPGPRVPALRTQLVSYRDGLAVEPASPGPRVLARQLLQPSGAPGRLVSNPGSSPKSGPTADGT